MKTMWKLNHFPLNHIYHHCYCCDPECYFQKKSVEYSGEKLCSQTDLGSNPECNFWLCNLESILCVFLLSELQLQNEYDAAHFMVFYKS